MATISFDVPDAAVPKLREAFGGETKAETLANIAAFLKPLLRQRTVDSLLGKKRAEDEEVVSANQQAELAAFEEGWEA